MPQLLNVCPRGAWLSEEQAVQFLGLASKYNLKDAFREGMLPHVYVEHGNRFEDVPPPFNKHRFFFVQKEEKPVSRPSTDFVSWVTICKSLEEGKLDSLTPENQARIKDYTGYTEAEDAYPDLKSTHGIISSSELSGEDGDDGYRYGSNGGRQRSSSKGPSKSSPNKADGDVYTRADGKRVRRVKRSNSGTGDALSGVDARNDNSQRLRRVVRSNSSHSRSVDNLSPLASKDEKSDSPKVRRLRRSNSSHAGSTHSRSIGGLSPKGGEKVRRIKRSSSSHSRMTGKEGLAGFLGKDDTDDKKAKLSGSRSVGAGEGEVYTRDDGKKGE